LHICSEHLEAVQLGQFQIEEHYFRGMSNCPPRVLASTKDEIQRLCTIFYHQEVVGEITLLERPDD
jgi:hypothetical protein